MANDFIKNYFGFNRQQRNGLFVLMLVSFLLLITRIVYPYFISPPKVIIQNLPMLERKLDSNFMASKKSSYEKYKTPTKTVNRFIFDPNTVSKDQLIKLGFGEKRAAIFLKFRQRGFIFRKKEDLQKVFGISGKFYEALLPYVHIEKSHNNKEPQTATDFSQKPIIKKQNNTVITEINSADSSALENVRGIGPAFSKRIRKYRTSLGGFTNLNQLKEVYGFTEEMFNNISPQLSVNVAAIKKLNLNKDDFKTINRHPYLSYETTKAIFDFRRKTALDANNLKEILNDDALYYKVLPYLVFD